MQTQELAHAPLRLSSSETALMELGTVPSMIVGSLVFAAVGIVVFAIAFWAITKMAPFSIRKEIEEDQNIALGIVIGAVIIGLSLIISAAIKG